MDGARLITRNFTIGQITDEQSVAIEDTGSALAVHSLDGAVTIPYDMVAEVAGAMLSVVLR